MNMNFRKIYEQAKLGERFGKQKNKKVRRPANRLLRETVQDAIDDLDQIIDHDNCSMETVACAKNAQRALFILGQEIGLDFTPMEDEEI